MTMYELSNYLNNKINENQDIIRITFYEIRVKHSLQMEQMNTFLELAKNKLENTGYDVYFTNDSYEYKKEIKLVKENELMIAIKKERK